MKERIVVEYSEVGKIAGLLGCSREMVSHSLAFRKNSKLARSIRKLAIERGGTKVGGNPQKRTVMKSDLMTLFGDQLRWFTRLNRKQRLCVLYFCLSFGILLSVVFDHPLLELAVVLNFGASARLMKRHVPLNDLEE